MNLNEISANNLRISKTFRGFGWILSSTAIQA